MSAIRLLSVCLAVAALSGLAQRASAGFFMDDYSGNSQFVNPATLEDSTADGVVNFAVYRNDDGNWVDDFGLTLTELFDPDLTNQNVGNGIDAAAEFVYFYQVVNTNPNPLDESRLDELEIFLPEGNGLVTSAGYISGYAFDDNGAATGPAGNARLGSLPDTTLPPDDLGGDGSPSETETPLGFMAVGGAVNPTAADETGQNTIEFLFGIAPNGYSSVMFLTSYGSPIYHIEELEDGGQTLADIPIPNPEPSSIAMTVGVCLTGLGLLVAKKVRA